MPRTTPEAPIHLEKGKRMTGEMLHALAESQKGVQWLSVSTVEKAQNFLQLFGLRKKRLYTVLV